MLRDYKYTVPVTGDKIVLEYSETIKDQLFRKYQEIVDLKETKTKEILKDLGYILPEDKDAYAENVREEYRQALMNGGLFRYTTQDGQCLIIQYDDGLRLECNSKALFETFKRQVLGGFDVVVNHVSGEVSVQYKGEKVYNKHLSHFFKTCSEKNMQSDTSPPFNIGDKVYTLRNNKVFSGVITKLEMLHDETLVTIHDECSKKAEGKININSLFWSKRDLLESL